jgi:hypothetical protein
MSIYLSGSICSFLFPFPPSSLLAGRNARASSYLSFFYPVLLSSISVEAASRSLAMLMSWVALIRYMQFDVEFYMLVLALKASALRCVRFIATVALVFAAYLFSGLLIFGSSPDVWQSFFLIICLHFHLSHSLVFWHDFYGLANSLLHDLER